MRNGKQEILPTRRLTRRLTRRVTRDPIVTVAGMSLAAVNTALEAAWTRTTRRRPQTRWARHHPALDLDMDELRHQLDDWRSPEGRMRFAELVDLARRGDHDAATLITLSVLPSIERYERRQARQARDGGPRGFDTLAGAVWEALITSRSYKPAHLREDIVRQAWLISRRRTFGPANEFPAGDLSENRSDHLLYKQRQQYRLASVASHEAAVTSNVTLTASLDHLVAAGRLSGHGRAILESIAAGRSGGSYAREGHGRAFAQTRLRIVTPLRSDTQLVQALTA